LFKGEVIIIYGARHVGKATLVKEIMADSDKESLCLNCDEPDVRVALTNKSSTELKSFIGSATLIIIDEVQRVLNIGLTLKLLIDNFPDSQIIAAGSSSFELSNKIKEPLTGRKLEFCLYPLSIKELTQLYSEIEINRLLAEKIVFGMYPGVIFAPDNKEQVLRELANSYSYKDVLAFQDMRKPEILERMLQALALQIGNEVSYLELAQLLGVSKETVENYIDILEKAYIIFKVGPFSASFRLIVLCYALG
jgi:predicted AAA+ superfamily ATPase